MIINWNKLLKTGEEIIVAEYIEDNMNMIEKLVNIYKKEDLIMISHHLLLNGNFYTYEVKFLNQDEKYFH